MPSRSHLTRPKPRNATIDLGDGDTVKITFDANKITPAWLREARKRDEDSDTAADSRPIALAEVMLGWDVTEDDGSAFPPTAENIGILSYPAQAALLEKMMDAAIPSSEEGNGSGNTSSTPTGDSSSTPEILPNGQAPSESPVPSASPSPT